MATLVSPATGILSGSTTPGGITFNQLCNGHLLSFVCDGACLVHVTHEDPLHDAEKKLVEKIEKTLNDIEYRRGAQIKKFFIGRSSVHALKSRGRINPLDPNTWDVRGISGKWADHRKVNCCSDGLVVVTVITKNQVPLREKEPILHQEQYTLALYQRLMHYYKIIKGDSRLVNKTLLLEKNVEGASAGYALYVAFSLKGKNADHISDYSVRLDHESLEKLSGDQDGWIKKRKRLESAEDEPLSKKQKDDDHVPVNIDPSVYSPTPWLKMTRPQPSPYFPQVGDIVIYFRQGHELYCEVMEKEKPCQLETQQMPWKEHDLKPQERCLVRSVHFEVGPPTLCSITLTLLDRQQPSSTPQHNNVNSTTTFSFKYHDMDSVPDLIILESFYKDSLVKQWKRNDRFQSLVDGSYLRGTVGSKQPYNKKFPESLWQCYYIMWDDGDTAYLSPWEMEPLMETCNLSLEDQSVSRSVLTLTPDDPVRAWDGEREIERIVQGLNVVMETLEESKLFNNPVDIKKEKWYCKFVPYPINLTTILERLKNGFYRRKMALIWDIVALSRNASAYNQDDSIVVEQSKILHHTLIKFIRSPGCSDPLKCYCPEIQKCMETTQDVTAPLLDFSEAEELCQSPPEVFGTDITTPQFESPQLLSSGEEEELENSCELVSITTTPTVRSQQFAVKREGSGDRDVTSDTVHDTGTFSEQPIDVGNVVECIEEQIGIKFLKLKKVFDTSLERLSGELFTVGIISDDVRNNPSTERILNEFYIGIALLEELKQVEEHCMKLFGVLYKMGGPFKIAGEMIKQSITDAIRAKLNIDLYFDCL